MHAFCRTHSHRGWLAVGALAAACFLAGRADAQVVVYRAVVPMFAPAAGPYVANYTPTGNYAAVSANSPPVFETVAMPVVPAAVVAPAAVSPAPVTSFYAPAVAAPAYIEPTYSAPVATTAYYAPATTAYYAPATTAYYAPATTAYYAPATTAYYAPATTAYYAPAAVAVAPAAVAVPLYRRGLFGAYRPVRGAYFPPY